MHTFVIVDVEWDAHKAAQNLVKHCVDFVDAVSALEDELAMTVSDPDSEGERRYVSIGSDAIGRVLVTVFTERDALVRIISSRLATRGERRRYEGE